MLNEIKNGISNICNNYVLPALSSACNYLGKMVSHLNPTALAAPSAPAANNQTANVAVSNKIQELLKLKEKQIAVQKRIDDIRVIPEKQRTPEQIARMDGLEKIKQKTINEILEKAGRMRQ